MGAMRFMFVFLTAVFTVIQGNPIEGGRPVISIGGLGNEAKKHLSICAKILKSICSHHSSLGCYDNVTQMQSRLASISFNSCDKPIVQPSKTQKEIIHALRKLNIKKMLNEIKKLDVNSGAPAESIIRTLEPLSSDVNKTIDTLNQLSSKCSQNVLKPTDDANIVKNICIVLFMAGIVLVNCYILIPLVKLCIRHIENTQSDSNQNTVHSQWVGVNIAEPIESTETPAKG